MLAHTKAAGKKILSDIQKIALTCSIITQFFYIFYLVHAIWTDRGLFSVNLVMLLLSCGYLIFFLHSLYFGKKKKLAATVTTLFKWSKRLIKLLNLGIMVYGIVYTATEPDPLSIVLTAVMAILWLADLLLEIAVRVIKSWWNLFLEGIQADVEIITKPIDSAKNFFKRVTGKEVEESAPPSKRRLLLNRLVEREKTEKKNNALEQKYLKQTSKLKKTAKQPSEDEIAVSQNDK